MTGPTEEAVGGSGSKSPTHAEREAEALQQEFSCCGTKDAATAQGDGAAAATSGTRIRFGGPPSTGTRQYSRRGESRMLRQSSFNFCTTIHRAADSKS